MSSKEQSCARNSALGVLSQHWRSLTAHFRHEHYLPLQAKPWRKSEKKQKLLQHYDATLNDIAVIAHLSHRRNRYGLSPLQQGRVQAQ